VKEKIMKKMLKKDLLADLTGQTGLTQNQCDSILSALAKTVARQVLDEDVAVTVIGLGTFSPSHRAARTGRNPATGGTVDIPAKIVIKFKPHSSLVKEG